MRPCSKIGDDFIKIDLIKIHLNDCNTYKYKPLEWCCRELKDNPCIDLCSEDIVNVNYEDDGRFIPRMCVSNTYDDGDYEDSWMVTENYPIGFCPHCGKQIELSTVGEEDRSEELILLEAERDRVLKQIRRTDSKKKTEELNDQRRILDKRINYLYEFGEYDEKENEKEVDAPV